MNSGGIWRFILDCDACVSGVSGVSCVSIFGQLVHLIMEVTAVIFSGRELRLRVIACFLFFFGFIFPFSSHVILNLSSFFFFEFDDIQRAPRDIINLTTRSLILNFFFCRLLLNHQTIMRMDIEHRIV